MRLYFLSLIVASGLLIGGCVGKMVDVVQVDHFKLMSDRMPEELTARQILDQQREYVSGLWPFGGGAEYGETLFQRLSPNFLFEDSVGGASGPTFASSIFPGDLVQKYSNGFTIRKPRQTLRVNMIAVTDWDGDGNTDWLVSCTVEGQRGGKIRDYYIVIPNPPEEGLLQGKVAAIYENFGAAGKLYMRDSVQKTPSTTTGTSEVEDSVPGLRPVTTPPDTSGKKEDHLQERSL